MHIKQLGRPESTYMQHDIFERFLLTLDKYVKSNHEIKDVS
jgi:hypothetical protein